MLVALLLAFSAVVLAQQPDMQMKTGDAQKTVALLPGLGTLHHRVSTKSEEAQRFFDQGLRMIYRFNHEAARSNVDAARISNHA